MSIGATILTGMVTGFTSPQFIFSIFLAAYLGIAIEHPLKMDKGIFALIGAGLIWGIIRANVIPVHYEAAGHVYSTTTEVLKMILGDIGTIAFFLLGALVIVEVIDHHKGFEVVTDKITTKNKRWLTTIITTATFFLSAFIDNMTATVVMIKLAQKLIPNKAERETVVGLIIIAANAGGVWSPVGDITTTMAWIRRKVTEEGLFENLFLPSLVAAAIPVLIVLIRKNMQGEFSTATQVETKSEDSHGEVTKGQSITMLVVGLSSIMLVPLLKIFAHWEPWEAMLLVAVPITWIASELLHPKEQFSTEGILNRFQHAISRVSHSSILFFVGILAAVGALEATGILHDIAHAAENIPDFMGISSLYWFIIALGLISCVFDNVPLMAAILGMVTVADGHDAWYLAVLVTGIGGSTLIIGSAAGVAAMGIEHLEFMRYARKNGWLSFVGFVAAVAWFLVF
jgi:Na+/H+ antiporter NhaD/arsenite permease-like protein